MQHKVSYFLIYRIAGMNADLLARCKVIARLISQYTTYLGRTYGAAFTHVYIF